VNSLQVLFAATAMLCAALTLHAQEYPNRVIRILTAEPGGGLYFQTRIIAQGLSASFGRQIIVENRGAGAYAAKSVAKSPPDGYTLLYYGSNVWLAPLLHSNLPWDASRDFAAAAEIVKGRKVHPDVRFSVTPASREVMNAAIRAGHIEILNDATAIVTNANCGACLGLHGGVLAPGDVAIACSTRNFEGRMGPNASIYLASPASVAASAPEGRITNPTK
jgi:hypothetical protein